MKLIIKYFSVILVSVAVSCVIGYGLGKLFAKQHHEAIQQIGKDVSCAK